MVAVMERDEYVRLLVTRVMDLTQPAPPGFWRDGRAWARLDARTDTLCTNEVVDDFLAGRVGKAEVDRALSGWLDMWREEYREHQRGVPL
jgi:hypothetical protein